jgi:hypothetical protein
MKKEFINPSFERVRKELKIYNVGDNEAPHKLIIAGEGDFLNIEHKRKTNSQFIIGVREFGASEKPLLDRLLEDLEIRSGRRPLAFFYDKKEIIETVIKDFEDYYNMPLTNNLFKRIGASPGLTEIQYCLIIVVVENFYYDP